MHASGTAGEVDLAHTGTVGSRLGYRVRSVLDDHGIVGNRERGAAASSGPIPVADAAPPFGLYLGLTDRANQRAKSIPTDKAVCVFPRYWEVSY